MEQSPLTQQPRPEAFQPKIVQLYDELLDHPDHIPGEGFWAEFFLLRPDRRALRERLDALTAGALLALDAQTRQLFVRAVAVLLAGSGVTSHSNGTGANGHRRNGSAGRVAGRANGGTALSASRSNSKNGAVHGAVHATSPPPAFSSGATFFSSSTVENTLATLATFLSAALAKKYNNPSSDVIDLLAGLDRVDAVLSDFVAALDQLLRHGRTPAIRRSAVDVALAVTAGAYQTTLLTYFIQRDLFPSIIKVAPSPSDTCPPHALANTGLL